MFPSPLCQPSEVGAQPPDGGVALPVVCVASDVMSSHAARTAVALPTLAIGASAARPSWSKIVAFAVLLFHCTQRFQSSRQLYAGMHVAPSMERCAMDPRPFPKYWHTIRLDVSAPARYVPHFAGHSAKEPLLSMASATHCSSHSVTFWLNATVAEPARSATTKARRAERIVEEGISRRAWRASRCAGGRMSRRHPRKVSSKKVNDI